MLPTTSATSPGCASSIGVVRTNGGCASGRTRDATSPGPGCGCRTATCSPASGRTHALRSSPRTTTPECSPSTIGSWATSSSSSRRWGYRLRTVEPGDLTARIDLHRTVWAPSRVTAESFADVQRAWPYRPDFDCIVEAPDGRLAASCLAWLDPANAAGELEPVGTHPDHRRRGVGSLVCRYALRRLREEGATRAVVYGDVDPANRGPKALYESIGFVETSRLVRRVRDR